MVRFDRHAVPKIGKFPQAVHWAKHFASHVEERYSVSVQLFAESNGTIHWVVDYPDYETFGRVRTEIVADKDYWGHFGRASELFVEGSIRDTVMSSI
jgi:hypothetical protein